MAKSPDEMTQPEIKIWRAQVLKSLDETTRKCDETLKKTKESKKILDESLSQSENLSEKWKSYENRFNHAMKNLVLQIGKQMVLTPLEPIKEEPAYEPEKMSPLDASKLLKHKRNIIILTGAGLSAASGIPTFRGNDGLWTKKYKYCDSAEDFATLRNFKEHPEALWEWMHYRLELCKQAEPNEGHKTILQFQEYCKLNGVKCHLITQNIDGLHTRLARQSEVLAVEETKQGDPSHGFTDCVFEIHGNLNYSRCFAECSKDLKEVQTPKSELSSEEQIPKCEECESIMRPHVLWFDECYTQELHRVDEVRSILDSEIDALIIVGTALQTSLASNIVSHCLMKNILTIDINVEPACHFGSVVEVCGKSEETLPILFSPFISKKSSKSS
ncbi:unnamed protein product [Moneuplotes crassus]|uniref:Deacetylase sirtuin-type domain-containing protein n=1 Tax=Euplotes crassus TaxID=5936 RepID=A0AAD1UFC3_EUPCR|nr:unnamed protein product [Moneuplotes crassus]